MGRTIKAELHYGYNLGDDEDGFQFAEVDEEYGITPTMPWWDEDGDDLAEQGKEQLLRTAGFSYDGPHDDAYYDRYRAAMANLGVTFERTGYEGGMTLLVAAGREYTAYTGDHTEIDPAAMNTAADAAADEALATALQALGITPKQDKPAWLLTCYYG